MKKTKKNDAGPAAAWPLSGGENSWKGNASSVRTAVYFLPSMIQTND
jgi:hypothetical protein